MVLDLYYDGVNPIIKCFRNIHPNYNGDMLVIYDSNDGFGEDNNLLAILKIRQLSEARSFIIRLK